MSREVFTDDKPELWDEIYESLKDMVLVSLKDKIIDYEENYIREGVCKKCGCCCMVLNKENQRVPCKYLIDNKDGTFDCSIYGLPERPKACINYPQKDNSHKCPNCGYYWIIK